MFRRLATTRSLLNGGRSTVRIGPPGGVGGVGDRGGGPRSLLVTDTSRRLYTNWFSVYKTWLDRFGWKKLFGQKKIKELLIETTTSQVDPLREEFIAAHNAAQSSEEVFAALVHYCARATPPNVQAFLKTLCSSYALSDPALVNDVLRLSLEHDIHLPTRACLEATDIDLLLALLKHELPANETAAAELYREMLRATLALPHTDRRFPVLARRAYQHLPDVRDQLTSFDLTDTYCRLAVSMAQIAEFETVNELLHARRAFSPVPERVYSAVLMNMFRNADVDRALELFGHIRRELDVTPHISLYQCMFKGLRLAHCVSEVLPLASSLVKHAQNDAWIVTADVVWQLAEGFTHWSPTETEAKQATLLLRLLLNAIIMARGDVHRCVDVIAQALFVLGDSDGSSQLFEAREHWARVNITEPFFELSVGVDPSIESIARPWLEKPLVSESLIDSDVRVVVGGKDDLKNSTPSATTQAQILIDRGSVGPLFVLITRYPGVDQYALVTRALLRGGVLAALWMIRDLERATGKGVALEPMIPVLIWHFQRHNDDQARVLLTRLRERGYPLEQSQQAGLLLDQLAAVGRVDMADRLFRSMKASQRAAWNRAAASTLMRWYRERKLKRFDALSKRCLSQATDSLPLPPRLWRTIAALNHMLGEREAVVVAALKHDRGRRTYATSFTLETMVKLVEHYNKRSQSFLELFD